MKYKIGDVAKLLTITPEAIRYYEDQGIIKPSKSESTGYRYYDVWDIHMLVRARSYRQYGYSLAESANLMNHCSIPEIVANHKCKEADIEKEIIWKLNLLKHLRQMQVVISEADANVGKYRLEYRPPMFRIGVQNSFELHTDPHHRAVYHDWIDNVPFVFPSALFDRRVYEQGGHEFSFGLVINEEHADLFEIKPTEDVAYFPSCLCVHTTLLSCASIPLSTQKLMPAINYIHSQGMKLAGDVISRVVLMNKQGDEYYSWHQLWLPIE